MSDPGVQARDSVQCEWTGRTAKLAATPDFIQFSQNYRASTETTTGTHPN